MWNKIVFGSMIFYMLLIPPSVLTQLESFFDNEYQEISLRARSVTPVGY
jgi:hypothetical protein